MDTIQLICQYCNKPFIRKYKPSQKRAQFCSIVCRNKARALKMIPCPICGTPFIPRVNDTNGIRKRYCSAKCGNESRKGKPSTNPFTNNQETIDFVMKYYREKGTIWVAEQLNKTPNAIRALWNKQKHDKPFCISDRKYDSVREYMTNHNPMKNPVTAAAVGKKNSLKYWTDKEYRLRYLSAQSKDQRKKASKPELLCKRYLEELKVEFIHSAVIKPKFLVDFQIGNLIIQVDGEYWHGHPRFEPLSERQLKQRKRDAAQDKYLKICGYKVVRIWENDVTIEHIQSIVESRD